jgi:hypothetical protein
MSGFIFTVTRLAELVYSTSFAVLWSSYCFCFLLAVRICIVEGAILIFSFASELVALVNFLFPAGLVLVRLIILVTRAVVVLHGYLTCPGRALLALLKPLEIG